VQKNIPSSKKRKLFTVFVVSGALDKTLKYNGNNYKLMYPAA
jgi:hypothetical protein